MSTLYPKLDDLESDQMYVTEPVTGTTGPRRSETIQSIQSDPENIEIILQIPSENVKSLLVDTVHSGIVGEACGPLNVRPPVGPNFGPTLELGNEVIELNDDLYVLHSELETFIIGGVIKDSNGVPFRGGPIPGKNFQAVVLLQNIPDNYIIDLTCIFMSNSNYKSTFTGEATKFSEMDTGDKIGHVIGVSASGISSGLQWTGEKTKVFIKSQSDKYVTQTTPNAQPTNVSHGTQKAVEYAAVGTKYLAKGTGVLAKAIGSAASYVGGEIAKEVTRRSDPNKPESKYKYVWIGVGKVVKSSVAAYGEIWSALELTGKSVAITMRDNTARAVTHKHGAQAGAVAYDGMDIGVNCTKTVFHVQDMGVKRICKNVAKSAGKNYLQNELDRRAKMKGGAVTQTSRPPPMITQ